MSDEHKHHDDEDWWLDRKSTHDLIYYGVMVSFFLSGAASFLPYEHHPHMPFEEIYFFSAVYGLVCCIGLVLAARWMRTVLMRDEDYYDE